jgi:two-component sensor histidine kinase
MVEPHGNGAEAARLRRQGAVLADFGSRALRSHDLDGLLEEACGLVSEACEVDLVKVLELLPDGDTMLLRAGVNWKPGIVGRATFDAHAGSPGGYALQTAKPVVSHDVARETRFAIPDLLKEHGVRSMVNVLIDGENGPWGVLEVDSRQQREFDTDDVAFLQSYANLLAAAIDRHRIHQALAGALEHGRMLHAELQHRGRNLLANIQALAFRTRASCPDLDTFATAFQARLAALGRTQDLLAPGGTASVDLRIVLLQELQAHGAELGERVVVSGPDVTLPSQPAQALGLGFHELATNASKHGALATAGGRLAVTWNIEPGDGDADLVIRWREAAVPIKALPERRGMGSDTIERSLPRMLGGTSTLTFHPDGVECVIRFPKPD